MATGSLQLGGNLSLAVGPLGRSAEASGSLNSKMRLTAMFSYSRSKGLYGGVSLEGTVLVDRSDANSKAYGHGVRAASFYPIPGDAHSILTLMSAIVFQVTAKQILSGNIDVPGFCEPLIGTIEKFTITGRVANARDAALAEEMRRSSLADSSSFESGRGNDGLFSDEEERAYERRRHDVETRNDGSYAFGSPMASITNTPTGMGRSGRERSGSTTYSNYGSYGAQDPFETRFEPSREREMDDFDRELQTPDWDGSRPTATRPGADSHFRAASYGGKAATPPPGGRRSDVGLWKRMRGGSKGAIAVDNAYMGDYFGDDSSSGGANRNGPRRSPPRARNGSSSSAFGTTDFDFPPRAGTRADTGEDLLGLGTLDEHRTGDADDDLFGSPTRDDRAYSTAFSAAPISSTARGAPLSPTSPTISTFGSGSGSSALYAAPATVAAPAISAPAIPSRPVNLGRVVALYDFEAVEAGDLGFERGDVITVTNKSESAQDWWQGRIMNREGRVREGR